MDFIQALFDFILHIDLHLAQLVAEYGIWIYAILFVIIFCETGLVITPFLPGDSLLFVAGALCALPENSISIHLLVSILMVAAVLGDAANYLIGRSSGHPRRVQCNGRCLVGIGFRICRLFFRRFTVRAGESENTDARYYCGVGTAGCY